MIRSTANSTAHRKAPRMTELHDPLLQRLLATFVGNFDQRPQWVAKAPGRVNLMGEHTDYNDGFVLPCAIGFQTLVAVSRRADPRVRVVAGDFAQAVDEFAIDAPITARARPAWANYVRGVFVMMARRGCILRGLNIAIVGDVPRGAGLSSSASLEVALAMALRAALPAPELSLADLALLAQQAENDFVGCQCGVMDQLISACGVSGHALLIDCRDLSLQPVPLPQGLSVMIAHSNVTRGLVDSAYNERREQCRDAARVLGVASLREATLPQLLAEQGRMTDTRFRRALHVITENKRTLEAAAELHNLAESGLGDLASLARLLTQSHASMRDDFEITVPAVDRLAETVQQAIARESGTTMGAARMTGGGFGGCVVALMPDALVPAVQAAIARGYRSPEGKPSTVWVSQPTDGARLMSAFNG